MVEIYLLAINYERLMCKYNNSKKRKSFFRGVEELKYNIKWIRLRPYGKTPVKP